MKFTLIIKEMFESVLFNLTEVFNKNKIKQMSTFIPEHDAYIH